MAASDPVIAAAGDIACDPTDPSYLGGAGTATACRQLYTSHLLLNGNFAAVLALGDNQYYCGTYQAYQAVYDPTWGRVKPITHPVAGNHEYGCSSSAAGYFRYFGSSGGEEGQGWYSFNVGLWHLIALNSQCARIGGCGVGSPQYNWLQSDLAANAHHCTLAYWHIPLFGSTAVLRSPVTQLLWQLLYSNKADVILNGHSHTYERFAPQDPTGKLDNAYGIREFIVGTGGANHTGFSTIAANSLVRNATTFGVLALTLHASGYDWKFIPESGTFTDSGSANCHNPPLPPTATANLVATSILPDQVRLDWSPSTAGTYPLAGYKVYRDGTLIATVKSSAYTDRHVQPRAQYNYDVTAYDSAGLTSGPSNALVVAMPAIQAIFADGFETGNLAKWNVVQGLVLESNRVATGQFAVRATSTQGTPAYARTVLSTPQSDLYYQIQFNPMSIGSYGVNLLQFLSAAGGPILTVRINPSHKIMYFNNLTGQSFTSNTTASMGSWHILRVHLHVSGTSSLVEIWFDHITLITLTHMDNLGTNAIAKLQFGEWRSGLTYDIAFDNIWSYRLVWPTSMAPGPSGTLALQLHGVFPVAGRRTPTARQPLRDIGLVELTMASAPPPC